MSLSLKNDAWISEMSQNGMIAPFVTELVRSIETQGAFDSNVTHGQSVISYGLSSYGYDIRLSPKDFKVFRHIPGTIVDPKNFNSKNLEPSTLHRDENGSYFVLPAHSYGLGVALERLAVPDSVSVLCIGKSTYARCFTGDTLVSTVDGDYSFLELIERVKQNETIYGWGLDDQNQVVAQQLHFPRYIEDAEIITIVLDDGEEINCTPDHEFLLKDGTRVQAQNLTAGASLRAIYFNDDKGYLRIWDGLVRKSISAHRLVMGCPESMEIHHKDRNKRNNHPNNLELMSRSQHRHLHNEEDASHIKGGQRIREMAAVGEFVPKWLHTPEIKAKTMAASLAYKTSQENLRHLNDIRKIRWVDPAAKAKQSEVAKNGCGAMRRRNDITEQSLKDALVKTGSFRGAARLLSVDRSAFRRFPEIVNAFKSKELMANHKVKEVKWTGRIEPTFCLTADRGNFALANGVFVSNCGVIANLTPAEAGWKGHLTLEFSNSSSADCRIYANEGVVQLLFLEGDPCNVTYEDRQGKYQNQTEMVTLAKV